MQKITFEAESLFAYAQSLRRDFHLHPELGFREFRTAGVVARELIELGYEIKTGIGKTGVVALLEGKNPGPTLMLRFDMDALPIQEMNDASYASINPGVMHACGHDAHTAIGLAVARLLKEHQAELSGTVKFVFQPAEEGLGGANAMIQEGVLEDPRPDRAMGLHVWNEKPVGWLGVTAGAIMSASEIFRIKIRGRGGHGGIPHMAVDPVLASAQVVNALQSIVSRNVDPLRAAVISVTMIHGGDAYNIIPSEVELQGTIRTLGDGVREIVLQKFDQVVNSVAQAMGCEAEIQVESSTPAVVNHAQVAQRVQMVAQELFPESNLDTNYRSMVAEDMALFLQEIPGCFVFVGSANHQKGLDYAHHHPRFDIDEAALKQGIALISAAALDYLQ